MMGSLYCLELLVENESGLYQHLMFVEGHKGVLEKGFCSDAVERKTDALTDATSRVDATICVLLARIALENISVNRSFTVTASCSNSEAMRLPSPSYLRVACILDRLAGPPFELESRPLMLPAMERQIADPPAVSRHLPFSTLTACPCSRCACLGHSFRFWSPP
jgi:hypothetical protein